MDQKTKQILILVGVLVAAVIVVKLVWKFWLFVLVGAICFVGGYGFALYQRHQNKKKK